MAYTDGSIGGLPFLVLTGNLAPDQQQLRTWAVPGHDGFGAKRIGYRAEPSVFRSVVDVADADDKRDTMVAYALLVGTLVTLVDANAVTYTNVLVRAVRPLRVTTLGSLQGGFNADPAGLLECEWELQSTDDTVAS